MLSDKVEVRTKHIEENQIIKIEFAKNSEYICLIYENKTKTQGTEIVLDYEQFMIVFPNGISEIKSFIEDNFLDCGVLIKILVQEKNQQETYICNLRKTEDILPEKICLNQYLDGIEVYVECNYKIIEEDSMDISIKKFVVENMIRVLTVPLISDEAIYDFETIYNKTDDVEQTISLLDDDYDLYNILSNDFGVVMRQDIIEGREDLTWKLLI